MSRHTHILKQDWIKEDKSDEELVWGRVARPVFEAPRLSERHTITSAESAPALDSILISLLSPMCCDGGGNKIITGQVCRNRPRAETRPKETQTKSGTHLFDFDPQLPLVDDARCLLKHRDSYIRGGGKKSQHENRLYRLVGKCYLLRVVG